MAAILRVRDGNGNIIELPSLQGESGKSAYEYAQEAGYTGTEEEFAEKLAEELNVKNGSAEYSVEEGYGTKAGDIINGFHIIEFSEFYVTIDFETGAMESHQAFKVRGGGLSAEEFDLLRNNSSDWQIIDEFSYSWGDDITFSIEVGNSYADYEGGLVLVCNEPTTLNPNDFPSNRALFLCNPNVTITRYGIASHAEGENTAAASDCQHVEGKWNKIDRNNTYAHIVGNGYDYSTRSNAHTLDWEGNAWYAGNVYANGDVITGVIRSNDESSSETYGGKITLDTQNVTLTTDTQGKKYSFNATGLIPDYYVQSTSPELELTTGPDLGTEALPWRNLYAKKINYTVPTGTYANLTIQATDADSSENAYLSLDPNASYGEVSIYSPKLISFTNSGDAYPIVIQNKAFGPQYYSDSYTYTLGTSIAPWTTVYAKEYVTIDDDGATTAVATQDYVQQYVEETILGGAW